MISHDPGESGQGVSLSSDRIFLRILEEADASDEYCGWLNDPDTTRYLVTKKATRDDLRTYIREKRESRNCLFFGIFLKSTGRHIGNVKLEPIDTDRRESVVGILIGDTASRGLGYCHEALVTVVDFAFCILMLETVRLGVEHENSAAIRCYEKTGFRKEEKTRNGGFFMVLTKSDYVSRVKPVWASGP